MLSDAIRGHMAELGIISAKGRNGTAEPFKIIANEGHSYRHNNGGHWRMPGMRLVRGNWNESTGNFR